MAPAWWPKACGKEQGASAANSHEDMSTSAAVKGSSWKELWFIVRKHPMTVIIPFLVFAVGVVVGVFVIRETEHVRQETSRTSAQNVAIQAAQSIELQLATLIQPVLSLKVFIEQGVHNYSALKEIYPVVASDLLTGSQAGRVQDYSQQLQVAPQANISLVYPDTPATRSAIGIHLLDLEVRRPFTLKIMAHERIEIGVLKFIQGPLGFRAITAVYVDNVPPDYNFSQPWPVSKFCPPDLCYKNATRGKFWGTIAGTFYIDAMLLDPNGPIQKLVQRGYRYQLVQRGSPALALTPGYGNATLLSRSNASVVSPEVVVINLDGSYTGFTPWELSVSPEDGWESSVEQAMYAVVVIVSALVAALLFAVLVSRVQNQALLFALVPEHVVNTLKSRHQFYSGTAVDVLATSTPAEVMLDLLAGCLEGELPQVSTVVQLRAALLSLQDLYRPANMSQALEALDLDSDVIGALMKVLNGSVRGDKAYNNTSQDEEDEQQENAELMHTISDDLSMQEVLVSMVIGKRDKKGAAFSITAAGVQSRQASVLSMGSFSSSITENLAGSQGASTKEAVLELLTGRLEASRRKSMHIEPLTNSRKSMHIDPFNNRRKSMHIEQSSVSISLAEPVWSELHVMLEAGWSSWTWDAFQMHKLTDGHALSTLGFFLMSRSGLIQQLGLSQAKTARFLSALEQAYNPNVPYHSSTHAADVLQTMHVIITKGGIVPGYADPIRHLACLLAAAAHDVEHTGLTNDFLINTESPLAIRYSDRSPMESHHLATMFTLLKHPDNDFIRALPKESRDTLRKTIIELVLGTDMKQHMTITSQFKSVHALGQKASARSSVVGTPGDEVAPRKEGVSVKTPLPVDETERTLSLQMALKLADLGALAESHEVAMRWVDVLEEEFFRQGDQERQLGLPISPLFDRNKPGASKSQVGFYSFVALPIFSSFVQVFPDAKPFLQVAEENFKYWKVVTMPSASTRASVDTNNSGPQALAARGPTIGPPAPTPPVITKRTTTEMKSA